MEQRPSVWFYMIRKSVRLLRCQSVQNAFLSAGNFLQDADEIVKKVEEMLKKWESFSLTPWGFPVRCTELSMSAIPAGLCPFVYMEKSMGNCTFKNGESFAPGTLRGEPDIPYIPDMVQSPIFIFRQRGHFRGRCQICGYWGLSGHETDWR